MIQQKTNAYIQLNIAQNYFFPLFCSGHFECLFSAAKKNS